MVADAKDFHKEGGGAVEAHDLGVFFEAVRNGGDFSESNLGAIARPQHDVFELLAGVGLAGGANENVAGRGADLAGWQVDGRAANTIGDVAEGEAEVEESVGFGLDGDFEGRVAGDFSVGDSGKGGELVAHETGGFDQVVGTEFAHDGDGHDFATLFARGHGVAGALGFGGEGVDLIDAGFDIFEEFLGVDSVFGFDVDFAAAAIAFGAEALDAAEAFEGALDGMATSRSTSAGLPPR